MTTTTESDKLNGMVEYLIGAFCAVFGKKHSIEIKLDKGIINICNTYEMELMEDENRWVISVWETYTGTYDDPPDAELIEIGAYNDKEAIEKVIDMYVQARLADYNEYCFEKDNF